MNFMIFLRIDGRLVGSLPKTLVRGCINTGPAVFGLIRRSGARCSARDAVESPSNPRNALPLARQPTVAQTPPPIPLHAARAYFAEDAAVTDRDPGRVWGVRPYGATFFVDSETRFTVASEPDRDGVLHPDGDLSVGILPQSLIVFNAPMEWAGKRWTMLM